MKKKKLVALLSIASLFSLTSCIILTGGSRINKDLTYTFEQEDEDKLRAQMTKFETALKEDDYRSIVTSWNSINNMAYSIATIRTIEQINYSMGKDESYEKYTYFADLVSEILSWEEKQYKPLAESKYKDKFFGDYTEEEIEKLINSTKPDEYYDIEKENQALIKQYNDLKTDTEEEIDIFNSQVSDIYKALVKNYNQEATLLGYSDYMEMSYKDVYSREYSVSDSDQFNEYVKDNIVPLYDKMKSNLQTITDSLTEDEKNNVKKFQERGSKSFDNYVDYLISYADALGGNYAKNFNSFRNSGYILFGDENANIDAAYTTYLFDKRLDQPIMYLGPSYQDVMTYVHEFGHYNAFAVNGAGQMSYDLAETQSQGNELLFISFLQHRIKKDESYNYIATSQIVNALQTIIMASIVNEFEKRVYKAEDLDALNLEETYVAVADYFGGYEKIMKSIYGDAYGTQIDYWKRVTITNAGYYISYAMSNIPSLEIYSLAKEDFSKGVEAYTKVYEPAKEYTQEDFLDIIKAANLYSPFDSKAYELINKLGE